MIYSLIDTVGIELYLTMLNEEVERLKGNKIETKEDTSNQPLINIETSINDNYTDEEDIKIEIHKKINSIDSIEQLNKVKSEIEDRFGVVDENMLIYMHEELFEKLASDLNITRVRQTKNFVEITLPKELTNNINGQQLFMNVSSLSRMFRFSMKLGMITITLDTIKLDKHFIYYLIDLMKEIKNCIKGE